MKFNERILASMRKTTTKIAQRATNSMARQLQRSMQDMMKKALDANTKAAASMNKPPMRDLNTPPPARSKDAAPSARTRRDSAAAGGRTSNAGSAAPQEFVNELLGKLGVQGGVRMDGTPGGTAGATTGSTTGSKAGRFDSPFGAAFKSPFSQGFDATNIADAGHADPATEAGVKGGRFLSGSFANQAGKRDYKLYVPGGYQGQSLPLIVMLHGCTQNPDDFAAGTRMNALAEQQPCLVLYPAQERSANHSRCWNWFNAIDQKRDQGEPSIIAGMTREIMATWKVDPGQVFVAGLSAGGAMAMILGTVYPDLYAAVGVHSGLPYAAASDLPSALAAMKSGARATATRAGNAGAATNRLAAIPVIVFHGDRDKTVNMRNGEQVLAQALPGAQVTPGARNSSGAGHAYTRSVVEDGDGHVLAEQWLVHGAGHAWSGGSASGSYTDTMGPDASAEMLRFFSTRAALKGAAPGAA